MAPFVMKVFEPLNEYEPSPLGAAMVRTPWRSEPAPGSVMAMAPIHSPETSFGIIRFFCSSVP